LKKKSPITLEIYRQVILQPAALVTNEE
jgi:hypothetical protein